MSTDAAVIAGVDIGGTSTEVVLCTPQLDIIARSSAATPASVGGAAMIDTCVELIGTLVRASGTKLLGVGVGTLCGACLSLILVYIINRQSFGWTLRLTLPTWTVGANLGLIFLTALAAGIWPARQAARVRLTETLRME